jgi:aspartate 4-decarboxylase
MDQTSMTLTANASMKNRQKRRKQMDAKDITRFANLSPFELKDVLIKLASRDSEKMMLNAGRGNPNFLALTPRYGFSQLGLFALSESERHFGYMPERIGGHSDRGGIEARFDIFIQNNWEVEGTQFLNAAVSYVKDHLGFPAGDFLHEMVQGYLGCNYPVPDRMLKLSEKIVGRYLHQEMLGGRSIQGHTDLFAVEGGTAAMAYIFNSLKENKIIKEGDKIALGTPIFTPYIEIPRLNTYRLLEIEVHADPSIGYQIPDGELEKLLDPEVKAFFLVNPSNPPSVRCSNDVLKKIKEIVETKRQDLIILTDDVYGTFADDFVSLYGICPHNTILVYSFSKYFGATGWRLGVIALHEDNVIDRKIRELPENDQKELAERYSSITMNPRELKFIDRLVADSRTVALNHTAGLSTPQQVQMVLFSLYCLMDEEGAYKEATKRIVRRRYNALYKGLGIEPPTDPNDVYYYTLIDAEIVGERLYGREFVDWALKKFAPGEFLAHLAEEAQVVLLPGRGFDVVHPAARASLANLREVDYRKIGEAVRGLLDKLYDEFEASKK